MKMNVLSTSFTHQKLTKSKVFSFYLHFLGYLILLFIPNSSCLNFHISGHHSNTIGIGYNHNANLHPSSESCLFNNFCTCVPLPNSLAEIHCFNAPLTSVPILPNGHFYRVTITGSNEITSISNLVFSNSTVSSFSLTSSKLTELDENSFEGTESTLTTLDLSDNHLRIFPTSTLTHLPLLQWLSLRGNEIEDLRTRDLASLANDQFGLRTLLLSDNRMSIIVDACFSRLIHLESLDLAGNMITRLEGRPFPSSLTSLSLSQNLLESIPINALANLGNLTWLQLRGNLIKSLPVHWFVPSTSLDILDLSHNLLSHLSKDVFTIRLEELDTRRYSARTIDHSFNRVTIGDLDLDFNILEDLTSDTFSNVAIRRLSLSNNKLSTLNNSLFLGPLEYSLQSLHLSFNLFTFIPNAISNLKRITSLFVKANQLTNLNEDTLIGCKDHLQSLDLSSNSFHRIPSEGLRSTSRLLRLNLQDNVISKVQESDLTSWSNGLLWLSLAKNNLEFISLNAFRHTKNLKELRLSFNQIHHTSTQALMPLRHTLVLLELTSALAPSTLTLLLKDISLLTRLEWLDLDLNSLSTSSLNSLTNLPNLIHVDLEGNRMTHLPVNFFSGTVDATITSTVATATSTTVTTSASKLRNIILSDNELSTLPIGIFHNLPSIMNIVLTGNRLSSIEKNTFVNLPNLQNVYLNRNKLTSISSYAFIASNSLSNLYLQENHLQNLPLDFVLMDSRVLLDARMVSEDEMDSEVESEYTSTTTSNTSTSEVNRNGFATSTSSTSTSSSSSSSFYPLPTTSPGLYINVSHNQLTKLGWSQSDLHVINSSSTFTSTSPTTSSSSSYSSYSFSSSSFIPSKLVPVPVRILDASHNNISQLGYLHPFCDRLNSLFLAHNQLSQLPMYSFSKCNRLSILSLKNNHISTLLVNCSTNETTNNIDHFDKCINASSSNQEGKNNNFLPSLQILDLSYNQILNLSYFTPLLVTLSNLRHLDVSFNRIEHLEDNFFSTLTSLEVLILASNTLVTFPPLNNHIGSTLRTLDLSFNRLTKVPMILDESNYLVTLKLTANRLTSLTKNLLRSFRSLKELYLNSNPLNTLDTQVFSFLVNLQVLDISQCGLEHINDLPLPKLHDLRMSNNKISNISSLMLSKARRLKHLDISHNELVDVPRNIWRFVPGLIQLDISFNPIEVLDTTSLTSLSKLRNLDMTGLSLKYVDSRLLYPLRYLISIKTSTYPAVRSFRLHDLLAKSTSLRSVSITVQESILSHQIQWAFGSKLQELVITGSNLVTILPDAFLGLYRTSGLVLRITGTNVTQLPPGLLRYLSNRLTLIDLRRNQLQTLNSEVLEFRDISPSRSVKDGSRLHFSNGLLLGQNPWKCSCNLYWLSQWLRRWSKENRIYALDSVEPDIFDFSCTHKNSVRRLIDFLRGMEVTCSSVTSSSFPSFSANVSTWPSLILATFVTLAQISSFTFFCVNV